MSGEDRSSGRRNGAKAAVDAPPAPPALPSADQPDVPAPQQSPIGEPWSSPSAAAPSSKEPRPQRFLFISKYGLIHDLAWEVKKEGHEVRYHITLKSERDVADGFVEKVDKWEESKDWADVIVFDDCEFGSLADKLRAEGKAVIGGTPYTDKLEMDRDFGQEEMRAAGHHHLPAVGV